MHCPKCNDPMGTTDVSLGEDFNLVFGLYCFACKEAFNFGFTLGYLSNECKKLYAKEADKVGKPVRPPLRTPMFTDRDKNFLTALKIAVT